MNTEQYEIEELPPSIPEAGRLGRHVHFDPKSKMFAAVKSGGLVEADAPLRNRTHVRRGLFDQGESSSCTGQSAVGLAITSPFLRKLTTHQKQTINPYAIYNRAQQLDPWAGAEPDYYGSTCLAAMKALKEGGFIREFRWCFGADDVFRTLAHHGPVVIGVNWYSSFDLWGKQGTLEIARNAYIRGGHAVELVGVNVARKTVRGVNSWGPGWGDKGRFTLSFDTLRRLLEENGEAVTAVL